MFVPTGVVHIIGPEAYTNLLCANNEFLQSITTVPLGDFQHTMLDIPFSLDANMNINQTNLYEIINSQAWCINVECSLTLNKVLIVTTKGQVQAVWKWADDTLPTIYNQHIPDKIDITMLKTLSPRCLDKPIMTIAATTYAAKLIQRTMYTTASSTKTNQYNQPLCACTTKPTMTFEESAFPPLNNNKDTKLAATSMATTTASTATPPPATYDYQAELQ